MRQDLDSRVGAIDHARHAELRADVVGTRGSGISGERDLGEVPPLLRAVLDESSRLKVCLGNGNVEDAGTR